MDVKHHTVNAARILADMFSERETLHEDKYKVSIAAPFDENVSGAR